MLNEQKLFLTQTFNDRTAGQHDLITNTKRATHEYYIATTPNGLCLSRNQFSLLAGATNSLLQLTVTTLSASEPPFAPRHSV